MPAYSRIEVVAGDAGDGLGVEAGEAREAVVLVDDDVARAQVGERAQRAAARCRAGALLALAAAADQPVLGDDRELELRRDEAVAQTRLDEAQRRLGASAPHWRLEAAEVVGGALARAPVRPRRRRCGSRSG